MAFVYWIPLVTGLIRILLIFTSNRGKEARKVQVLITGLGLAPIEAEGRTSDVREV
jgi:hypothetical protein